MKQVILYVLVLMFLPLFSYAQDNSKNQSKNELEVMVGTGFGIGYAVDMMANITYTIPVRNDFKVGGGIGYDLVGAIGMVGGSVPDALSFFADFRNEKPRGKKISQVFVFDMGAYIEMEKGGSHFGGALLNPQFGWSFKFSESGNAAFDTRIYCKGTLGSINMAVLGIMIGLSF